MSVRGVNVPGPAFGKRSAWSARNWASRDAVGPQPDERTLQNPILVWGLWVRVWGLKFECWGLGSGVEGFGFAVLG